MVHLNLIRTNIRVHANLLLFLFFVVLFLLDYVEISVDFFGLLIWVFVGRLVVVNLSLDDLNFFAFLVFDGVDF